MRVVDRIRCGRRVKPLFEKAARSGEGGDLGRAQRELAECLGLELDVEVMSEEIERWFSYFNLHNARVNLREGDREEALELLRDLEESYSPERRRILGIEQDLGPVKTEVVYRLTRNSRRLAERGLDRPASRKAGVGERLQYWMNISKAGTPPPE